MAPHCCLLYLARRLFSNPTSKRQNRANCANTMAATSEYISVKNRNVAISRTAQVDNHFFFLGNMSTAAQGLGGTCRPWHTLSFILSQQPRRFLLTLSHQVPVEVRCFISQGGTEIALIHLNACKNIISMVMTLLYEGRVTSYLGEVYTR